MAAEMAETADFRVMEAPLVEAAYMAAVESGMGKDIDKVTAAVTKEFGS